MKRLIATALAGTLIFSSCGSSDSASGVNEKYAGFCELLISLAESATSSHEENPAAITDPKVFESERKKDLETLGVLVAKAPSEIKGDLKIFIENARETNKVYAKYDYDLVAMSKNADAQKELAKISNDQSALDAKEHYQNFLTKNCAINSF